MQRATVLVATVLGIAVQPAAALPSALPEVPTPSLPDVQLPSIPDVELPSAPPSAPTVEPPKLPPVQVPTSPAPLPSPALLPSLPASGDDGSGVSLAGVPAGSERATGASSTSGSGEAPSGGGANAHAARDSRSARRNGPGVFGTRHKTPRALVHALRGCLDRIAPRQATVLFLRYGVGGFVARAGREVARVLGLSVRDYVRVRRRAFRALMRVARRSSCDNQPLGVATLVRAVVATARGYLLDPSSPVADAPAGGE